MSAEERENENVFKKKKVFLSKLFTKRLDLGTARGFSQKLKHL